MPMILENDHLIVSVSPDFGGRVTRLVDRLTGRDWIAQGGNDVSGAEDASFLAGQAGGWDECFPTVSPSDARATVWGRQLRDHGDIWGRPMAATRTGPDSVRVQTDTQEFGFVRTLALDGSTLVADYAVQNRTDQPMPYLWAMHLLLATGPPDQIVLPGVMRLTATYIAQDGVVLPISSVNWPTGNPHIGFPLDQVQPAMGFAGKFYCPAPKQAVAQVIGRHGGLEIAWDSDQIGHIGLWLGYGGWPTVGQVHQIAIEPATASADHLGQAIAAGQAAPLHPGEWRRWTVRLTVTPALPQRLA